MQLPLKVVNPLPRRIVSLQRMIRVYLSIILSALRDLCRSPWMSLEAGMSESRSSSILMRAEFLVEVVMLWSLFKVLTMILFWGICSS